MTGRALIGLIAAAALAVAATPASSATRFGSKLTPTTQPANAGRGILCRQNSPSTMCTAVMTIARNRPPSATQAPKDGTIAKLRLIACYPGTFVLQIARLNRVLKRARVTRTGPLINYRGDRKHCTGETFEIEEFRVNVPVKKGDALAVLATKIGFLYSAGDNGSLAFDPPLADGQPVREAFDEGTGIILLEAEYDD
ncbi:hypothetical protein [Hansschlegelia sp. KR7-227]|uniref:hypothetical protein n=1 Tax=Hansschlegelia sp. KR7-227 TaxID=3400914 RepID=UPI003C023B5A